VVSTELASAFTAVIEGFFRGGAQLSDWMMTALQNAAPAQRLLHSSLQGIGHQFGKSARCLPSPTAGIKHAGRGACQKIESQGLTERRAAVKFSIVSRT
jgi:hypothetical protein